MCANRILSISRSTLTAVGRSQLLADDLELTPKCQITRLQQIQNSLTRAVVKAPKFTHITPILRSLHPPVSTLAKDN